MNSFPPAADADFRDPTLAGVVRTLGLYHPKTGAEYEWRLQTSLSHAAYQQLVALRTTLKAHAAGSEAPSQVRADELKYFDFLASHERACRATLEGRLAYYDRLLPLIRSRLSGLSRARILDLGCFGGLSTIYLGAAFPDSSVVGIERCEGIFAVAEEHRRAAGLPNVSLVRGDYDAFEPETPFDVVVSLQALPCYMLPPVPSESPEEYRRGGNLAAEIDNPSSPCRAIVRSMGAIRGLMSGTGFVLFNERLHGLARPLLFHAILARTGLGVLHAHMVDWHMANQRGELQTSPLIVAQPCDSPGPLDEAAVIDLYRHPAGFTDLSDLPAGQSVTWQGFDASTNYRCLPGSRDELLIAGEAKGGHRFHQRLGVLGERLAFVYIADTMDQRSLTVGHARLMRPMFKAATDQLQSLWARGDVVRFEPSGDKLSYALAKRFRRYER